MLPKSSIDSSCGSVLPTGSSSIHAGMPSGPVPFFGSFLGSFFFFSSSSIQSGRQPPEKALWTPHFGRSRKVLMTSRVI